jgi:hypothetical protein
MKNSIKKLTCVLLATLTCISILVAPVTNVVAEEDKGNIHIAYVDEGTKIEDNNYVKNEVKIDGATFSAVLVAKEGNGEYVWIDEIKEFPNFNYKAEDMFDIDKHEIVTKTLLDIAKEKLAVFTRTTNEEGKCTFENIAKGVYIIWESKKENTAKDYNEAAPCLVVVPDRKNDKVNFDVSVYPKTSKNHIKLASITGIKSWKGEDIKPSDKDNKENNSEKPVRPESITLRLYANGVEVGKTTTNAQKGWAFSFDDVNCLDENGQEITFTIKEDKVKGYVFSQDKPIVYENTIVINVTNTVGEESAKTGDETNIIMWIAIAGICMCICIVLLIPKRKKQTIAEKVANKNNK